jgi:uncharacterized protein
MHTLTGKYATPNGSKYLQQLCKHFGHKIEVDFSETEGLCTFEMGKAFLNANEDGLTIRFELLAAEHAQDAKMVIDKHLERFAFRENFEHMDWTE